MRIAVIFDTPYRDYRHDDHLRRLQEEFAPDYGQDPEPEYQIANALRQNGHDVIFIGVYDDIATGVTQLRDAGSIDLAFNVSEGFGGNDNLDYLLPAMLEAEGYRYTGAPPLALMVTRNKAMSKKILLHHGIHVPDFVTYRLGDRVNGDCALSFPAIVKPLQLDASDGISQASVVHDKKALAERVKFVHERFEQPAIAEEFIDGRELYVSIIGNGDNLTLLPPIELVFDKEKTKPQERIATKAAKWDDPYRERKGIRNVFARPLSKVAQQRLAEACELTYRALWLRDYARLDIRLTPDDKVWVLEANANPYINEGHEIASSARKAGMDYPDFIQRIVKEALARDH